MRIFSLEYIRKMLNSNEIHFVSTKKRSQFRIKTHIGSFVCNNISAGEEADKLLKEMRFRLIFAWPYDPLGIISKLSVENKTTSYTHNQRPEIERYVN